MTAETPGFDRNFYRALSRGQLVSFEADYTKDFIKNFYCRKVRDMRWHTSPPLDLLPLRYVFGFSKTVDNRVIDTINKL